MRTKSRGFTLIELMIVIAVVAVLAAVAYPLFMDSVRKARRAEAMSGLEAIRLSQAKHRANNATYRNGFGGMVPQPASTHYTLAITAANAVSFTATATAAGDQANDSDCTVFSINQDGPVDTADAPLATCWKR